MSDSAKPQFQIGGLQIDTVTAPRPSVVKEDGGSILGTFIRAIKGLAGGMKTTLSYFLRPSTVVTQQYPENRETLEMFDRFRSRLELIHDEETGHHACTACELCEKCCPNASIIITKRRGETTKKWELDRFIWRQDSCTFCNICVMVCPFDTLKMSGDFESSVYDRRLLIYNLNHYAGPAARVLQKVESPEELAQMLNDRALYSGDMPMCGVPLDGVKALGAPPAAESADSPEASEAEDGS
jgi:NADH-quinone oxidoreductase subunit I